MLASHIQGSCSTCWVPPGRLCPPLRQCDQARPFRQDDQRLLRPGGPPRRCLRCHDIRNCQKPGDNTGISWPVILETSGRPVTSADDHLDKPCVRSRPSAPGIGRWLTTTATSPACAPVSRWETFPGGYRSGRADGRGVCAGQRVLGGVWSDWVRPADSEKSPVVTLSTGLPVWPGGAEGDATWIASGRRTGPRTHRGCPVPDVPARQGGPPRHHRSCPPRCRG